MSARYGSRTRSGEAISNFGRKSSGGGAATASGGTESTVSGYKYHKFTSSGTLTVAGATSLKAEVFVIGGGGGSGTTAGNGAGGGGGGGVYLGVVELPAGSHTITVGGGGAVGADGNDSSLALWLSAEKVLKAEMELVLALVLLVATAVHQHHLLAAVVNTIAHSVDKEVVVAALALPPTEELELRELSILLAKVETAGMGYRFP